MTRLVVRNLTSDDLAGLRLLEAAIFGAAGDGVLGPHYLRPGTLFGDTCFLALADGRPVGYLLGFVRDRDAYCTTLAVRTEFQRTRVTPMLLAAFVRTIVDRVDTCWFTVEPGNAPARQLHATLGATEVGRVRSLYGPGDERIVSTIDQETFARVRARYEKLGLIPRAEARTLREAAA